jgi:hypothetical protein
MIREGESHSGLALCNAVALQFSSLVWLPEAVCASNGCPPNPFADCTVFMVHRVATRKQGAILNLSFFKEA